MNGIVGMTDLALHSPLLAEQREYLEMVRSSSDPLLELINDILDFSTIGAGKLSFEHDELLLRDTLVQTIRMLTVRTEEQGIELVWRVNSDVPAVLVGDSLRLRQVLTNLLSNAIKFTDHGEVDRSVGLYEPMAGSAKLLFAGRDTGIVIPSDKLDEMFVLFSQGEMSTTRKYGDTGLGRTISERLVQLMGGRIWINSVPGEGSTFLFTARLDGGTARVTDHQADGKLAGLNVLVVEDKSTQLLSQLRTLDAWGMDYSGSQNIDTALEVLDNAAAFGSPYEMAIIDSSFAGISEKKLMQRLRNSLIPALCP
jgi:two-component system, sensor histidine kinase and response regulator